MGMSIEHVNKLLSVITATITEDDDCFTIEDENLQVFKEALLIAIDTMRKYQMMQADYKARLRADMAAMLEDLKKEMNPIKDCEYQIYGKEHWNFVGKCQDVIQQKIDELKVNSHDD